MCRCAESYVDTVSGSTWYSPPPMTPTGTPNVVRSTSYHWRTRSSVGATTSVLRRRSSIARHATHVLPAPVGNTTTPRWRRACHAASASDW